MTDLIRNAPIGQLIRYFTNNRLLQYAEERDGFVLPACYENGCANQKESPDTDITPMASPATEESIDLEKAGIEEEEFRDTSRVLSLARTLTDISKHEIDQSESRVSVLGPISSRIALERAVTHADLEMAFAEAALAEKEESRPVEATKLANGVILVDWYSTTDPENPQNWSTAKKALVTFLICIYTTGVYTGSAIYAPSEEGVMERFGVGATAASLGLALYVVAYGVGPLIFSPLSEIPLIGRNPPYMISFAIFVILCIPTALVDNFAGLLVLRFLQGFFGSPCLATGGATLQDMYSLIKLPYVLTCWAAAACVGPAMGPIISGFSVSAENWRWSLWEMLWLAGPIWLALFFLLPETYPENILLRRAARIRKLTGKQNYKSQSEMKELRFREVAREALIRPMQLIMLDPAIAFADLYIALCYAIFYSFFEVFPFVYIERYGFNVGEMGLTFLAITIAVVIASSVSTELPWVRTLPANYYTRHTSFISTMWSSPRLEPMVLELRSVA